MANRIENLHVSIVTGSADRPALRTLQDIGRNAWSDALPSRTSEEIDHVYPHVTLADEISYREKFDSMTRWHPLNRMRELGAGVLVVASSPDVDTSTDKKILGYAWIRNNVSGSKGERALKTYGLRRPPYVTVQSINVDPQYKGLGIGTGLLLGGMTAFKPEQPPTAFIYAENEGGQAFFDGLGFDRVNDDPDPIENRFGHNTNPALQYMYKANSVQGVFDAARLRLIARGIELR